MFRKMKNCPAPAHFINSEFHLNCAMNLKVMKMLMFGAAVLDSRYF